MKSRKYFSKNNSLPNKIKQGKANPVTGRGGP
jgi:hypothetical protein